MTEGDDGIPGFSITRVVDAPRATVWRLWTDPDELARWFHPRELQTPRDSISVDLRPGGAYAYTMVDNEGTTFPTGGTYQEVSEPERLVFTWGSPDDPTSQALITVSLTERGRQTEVTLEVRGLEGRSGDQNVYDGWAEALDNLAAAAVE